MKGKICGCGLGHGQIVPQMKFEKLVIMRQVKVAVSNIVLLLLIDFDILCMQIISWCPCLGKIRLSAA